MHSVWCNLVRVAHEELIMKKKGIPKTELMAALVGETFRRYQPDKTVTIEVLGGVATVRSAPKGIKVVIVDLD